MLFQLRNSFILLACSVLLCIKQGSSSGHRSLAKLTRWSYAEQKSWANRFPTCNANEQSPIDLSDYDEERARKLVPEFDDLFHKPLLFNMVNNGHTVELKTVNGEKPMLRLFKEEFQLEQFHFHWGVNDRLGSEHRLYGKQFAAEMHLVFSNKRYGNMLKALGNPTGILVLGVLLKPNDFDNELFTPITDVLELVERPNEKTVLSKPLAIGSLLPAKVMHVFLYRGSLTTPPCTENVLWVVLSRPLPIGSNQLQAFRQLKDDEGNPIGNTFRHVQPLNDRVIRNTF